MKGDRIEEQLSHQPTEVTRNRKPIVGLTPPWEHQKPVWELRIGEHRVFYDVDERRRQSTISRAELERRLDARHVSAQD